MNFYGNQQFPPVEEEAPQPRFSIPIPFLKQQIGAGDVVANMTQAAGIQPCVPCKKRQEQLNQAVVFRPMGE